MSVRNVVRVMNFHALVRVDNAKSWRGNISRCRKNLCT